LTDIVLDSNSEFDMQVIPHMPNVKQSLDVFLSKNLHSIY